MLRLHRCHPNKLNIYNQVGLVAVIPIGWPRYQRPDRDVKSLGPAVVDAALELGIDDKSDGGHPGGEQVQGRGH